MNPLILAALSVISLILVILWLVNTPAHKLASTLLYLFGLLAIALGGLLIYAGRFGYGLPIVAFGFAGLLRGRSYAKRNRLRGYGCLRGAAVEIYLSPYGGNMLGTVLAGQFEGQGLPSISLKDLVELHKVLSDDDESRALLEAYMDSKFPIWRDSFYPGMGDGFAGSESASPMNEQEAYQILGLDAGARAPDISKAHTRLVKAWGFDTPAGSFVVDRLNEARSVLQSLHQY